MPSATAAPTTSRFGPPPGTPNIAVEPAARNARASRPARDSSVASILPTIVVTLHPRDRKSSSPGVGKQSSSPTCADEPGDPFIREPAKLNGSFTEINAYPCGQPANFGRIGRPGLAGSCSVRIGSEVDWRYSWSHVSDTSMCRPRETVSRSRQQLLCQTACMRVVAAVDKFRGTLDAREVALAVATSCRQRDEVCVEVPLADGGEGLLEAFGGANQRSVVSGPDGSPVEAQWRLSEGVAIIEMARASGLALAGGARANRPEQATTRGVGELMVEAANAGASRMIVGMGGSATTDGGCGAVDVLRASGAWASLADIEMVVACDVDTVFCDAARVFGPQKGADSAAVERMTVRLVELADRYRIDFGVDVTAIPGTGAAGGLAGGLAAIGARVESGFDLVADEVGLRQIVASADLVITGEGSLDPTSKTGKVVGGVSALCAELGVPVHAIAGVVRDVDWVDSTSLVDTFGEHRALTDTAACVSAATESVLATVPTR
ncbi:glycerate kinase [Ilumatobacter sp.]|uniref:glycerate kinase family protein n=1 Tax=Ilumatobacter sp. TaxID=1967498 RepID=UPI003C62E0FA